MSKRACACMHLYAFVCICMHLYAFVCICMHSIVHMHSRTVSFGCVTVHL